MSTVTRLETYRQMANENSLATMESFLGDIFRIQ
jgi:hypothetical protein